MKYLLTLFSFFLYLVSFAQGDSGTDDLFKSDLKIYVVVAVLAIILACLFAFMFSLERRLKELEKR